MGLDHEEHRRRIAAISTSTVLLGALAGPAMASEPVQDVSVAPGVTVSVETPSEDQAAAESAEEGAEEVPRGR